MRKIHHVGVIMHKPFKGEEHNTDLHLFCSNVENSKNRFEFLRFEENCPFPDLVKNNSHIAYQVDSMENELKHAKLIYGPFTPVKGMDVAFIEEEGMPIELDFFY